MSGLIMILIAFIGAVLFVLLLIDKVGGLMLKNMKKMATDLISEGIKKSGKE